MTCTSQIEKKTLTCCIRKQIGKKWKKSSKSQKQIVRIRKNLALGGVREARSLRSCYQMWVLLLIELHSTTLGEGPRALFTLRESRRGRLETGGWEAEVGGALEDEDERLEAGA